MVDLDKFTKAYLKSIISESQSKKVTSLFGAKHDIVANDIFIAGPKDTKFQGYVFKCNLTAAVESDGIGPYEFWGSREFDAGEEHVTEWDLYDYPTVYEMNVNTYYDEKEDKQELIIMPPASNFYDDTTKMSFKEFCKKIKVDNEDVKATAQELVDALLEIDEETTEIMDYLEDHLEKYLADKEEDYIDPPEE